MKKNYQAQPLVKRLFTFFRYLKLIIITLLTKILTIVGVFVVRKNERKSQLFILT